ncbi:VQ motif-containing protein 25-like [Aristolochia californica]|uniref:VQ motif-containing protein 25-like n=1 Tax=Aristolochia californica TaxID=171875 RepID=UPI0035DA0A32
MEKVMNPPRLCESKAPASCLTVRKESHLVSKQAPMVRIIHIYAPEIIKTDVANFRELVQRLTGKPVGKRSAKSKGSKIRCKPSEAREISRCNSAESSDLGSGCKSSDCSERVKEEEEIWGGENFSFFGGLGDLDGFIQGLTDQFPLAPLSSSQMDVFGGGHFS